MSSAPRRETRVRQRDSRLVSECLDERDVLVAERLRLRTHDENDTEQVFLDEDRNPEYRAVGARAGVGVLGIVMDVGNVDGSARHSRAAGCRRSIEGVRMLPVIGGRRNRRGLIRDKVKQAVLEQKQRAVVGTAESLHGLDYLVENRLKPGRASDRPQDPADRPLLLARVLELTRKVRVRGPDAAHRQRLVRSRE